MTRRARPTAGASRTGAGCATGSTSRTPSRRALDRDSVRWSEGVAHVRDLTARHSGAQGHGIGRHRLLEILAARGPRARRTPGVRARDHGRGPARRRRPGRRGRRGPQRPAYPARRTLRHGGRRRAQPLRLARHHEGVRRLHLRLRRASTFVETGHGWIWCYGYGPGRSTCVIECAPETWTGLGLDRAGEDDGRALLEKLFADVLDGHPCSAAPAARPGRPSAPSRTAPGTATTSSCSATQPTPRTTPSAPAPPSPWRTRSPWPPRCASGTRTSRATCTCHPSGCSPCSASAIHPCCRTSRRSCTTGSTGRPGSWIRCAGSSAGWVRRSGGARAGPGRP